MNSLPSCACSALSFRRSCQGLRTTRAERSRSWLLVRCTGSELQASTALAREISAQSASSKPASLASLELPLLLRLPRWHTVSRNIGAKIRKTGKCIWCAFRYCLHVGHWCSPHHLGGSFISIGPDPGVFHVHGSEEEPLIHFGSAGSDGVHPDIPWRQDVLLGQFQPSGQRAHRQLCLQPTSCRLPDRCKEWARLRPSHADPLDSRWSSFSFYLFKLPLTLKWWMYQPPLSMFSRSQYTANITIQSWQQCWGWQRCCWQVTRVFSFSASFTFQSGHL